MKILYLSCHSILEADEISLFHDLGHEVFSIGAYLDPSKSHDNMRPALPHIPRNQEDFEAFQFMCKDIPPGKDSRGYLTKEFVDRFDVVIVMHIPPWIEDNWHVLKSHKRVVWRTIGQSVASIELRMQPYRNQGLQIVRYSPREANIPHFAGQDAVIRFYKDEKIFSGWNGNEKTVITFSQDMKNRDTACNYTLFEQATKSFSRKLYGPQSESVPFGMGKVLFDTLLAAMRDNRVYFYTGTHPASYTLNFMEAFMIGTPMVCIGPLYGNAAHLRNHDLYEIPDFIENGVNGFISDSVEELTSYISQLIKDFPLARTISTNGRNKAIELFSKEKIMNQWKEFLGD